MFVVCVLLGPALWCCGTGHSYMESKDSCEVQQNKWRVLQLEPSSNSGPICASCTFQCDAGAREQLGNLISGHGRRQSDPGHSDPAPVTGARPTPCHQVAPAGSHSCHQPPNCSWNISALWHWLCMAWGFGAREDVIKQARCWYPVFAITKAAMGLQEHCQQGGLPEQVTESWISQGT